MFTGHPTCSSHGTFQQQTPSHCPAPPGSPLHEALALAVAQDAALAARALGDQAASAVDACARGRASSGGQQHRRQGAASNGSAIRCPQSCSCSTQASPSYQPDVLLSKLKPVCPSHPNPTLFHCLLPAARGLHAPPPSRSPVGWNCTNSRSCSGRPARAAMALPSPVHVCALVAEK